MERTARLTGEDKQQQWMELAERIRRLGGNVRALRSMPDQELTRLIDDYQSLIADLARARSLGAAQGTIDQLNRIAVAGHNLLYGRSGRSRASKRRADWFGAFPRAVRRSAAAVLLAIVVFFGPAVVTYLAIRLHPELGYDLVPEGLYDFTPQSAEHMHEIPSVFRPVASSGIIANNIWVTLFVFGLGLTLGIGTTYFLVVNGVHLGSIAGWLAIQGHSRALWGWIMPHGGTELLAVCLSGAAGYLLAGAILMPGRTSRSTALKRVGPRALVIELGCMAMLVVAGWIEGFVSPSSIGYPARIAILATSLFLWAVYLLLAGWRPAARDEPDPALSPAST